MLELNKNLLLDLQGTTCEMIVEFEFEVAKEFGIKVLKSAKKETVIGYNVEKEELYIDRSNSGETTFSVHGDGSHGHSNNSLDPPEPSPWLQNS
ncbi:GH32 C-terminal domain-containing protein [Neobacillus drentensis]|uniref:GH32 C-terminal domain-containing protein n=1 Tax=Neobacillus drentensis TaxID=220684 RepID=UPI003B588380